MQLSLETSLWNVFGNDWIGCTSLFNSVFTQWTMWEKWLRLVIQGSATKLFFLIHGLWIHSISMLLAHERYGKYCSNSRTWQTLTYLLVKRPSKNHLVLNLWRWCLLEFFNSVNRYRYRDIEFDMSISCPTGRKQMNLHTYDNHMLWHWVQNGFTSWHPKMYNHIMNWVLFWCCLMRAVAFTRTVPTRPNTQGRHLMSRRRVPKVISTQCRGPKAYSIILVEVREGSPLTFFIRSWHVIMTYLRAGFLRCIQLILRLRPGGLVTAGPPCGSFTFINMGTSGRTKDTPFGGKYAYVKGANK